MNYTLLVSTQTIKHILSITFLLALAQIGNPALSQSSSLDARQMSSGKQSPYKPGDAITLTIVFAKEIPDNLKFTVVIRLPEDPAGSSFAIDRSEISVNDRKSVKVSGNVPLLKAGHYRIVGIEAHSDAGGSIPLDVPHDAPPVDVVVPDLTVQSITTSH